MSSMNEKDSRIDISCDDKLLDPEMIETEKVVRFIVIVCTCF